MPANLPNVIEIAHGPNKYRNMRKAYAAYFKSSSRHKNGGRFFVRRVGDNMRSMVLPANQFPDQMKRSGSVQQLGFEDGVGQYESPTKIDGIRNMRNNKSTLQYRKEDVLAQNNQFSTEMPQYNPY